MRALARDERGAIMIAALFMAIFAAGCLHYVVALASAIEQRERMQDAADAAAFSSAVLHARGMNVIALINMTMAALLAVLIALKLVQMVAGVGVAFATGLAFLTSGASLAAVPLFTNAGLLAAEAYEQAEPVVHGTLKALHIAARGVRIAIPWVAQAQTVSSVMRHYDPPADFGFMVPGQLTLPTRDGTYKDLCTKSGEYVGDLVDYGLGPINTPGFSIGDLTSGLVDAGSSWFCETEGESPPSVAVTREDRLPKLPLAAECEAKSVVESSSDFDLASHAELCLRAERETALADAAIHARTGACIEGIGVDCGPAGLYELRAKLALQSCAPREPDSALDAFWYQTHSFTRRYAWVDDAWRVEEEIVPGTERLQLWTSMPRPCGVEGRGIGAEWHTGSTPDGAPVPICDNIAPPEGAPYLHGDRDTLDLQFTEVLRVFRCRERIRERRELDSGGGDLAADDDGSMAPQLLPEDAALGDELFQLRAFVVDTSPTATSNAILDQLDSPEEAENEAASTWETVRKLGGFSMAQAEIYFDGGGAPDSYLWAMRWSARLRPFRLAEREPAERSASDVADADAHGAEDVKGTFETACNAAAITGFSCSDIDLDMLARFIEH